MKKTLFFISTFIGYFGLSQVGINTITPNTLLDVQANRNASGVIVDNTQFYGIQAPRLTRDELTKNTATYGHKQNGALIYITDISEGNANSDSQRQFITSIGYYYYDANNNKWKPLYSRASEGLTQNSDNSIKLGGTISNTATITGAKNTFEFRPQNEALVISKTPSGNSIPTLLLTTPKDGVNSTEATIGQASSIGFNPNGKKGAYPIIIGAKYFKTDESNGVPLQKDADFFIATSFGNEATTKLVLTNSGNLGIGSETPTEKLEVNGKLKVNNTGVLTSSSVSPLFVDENGLIGKSIVSPGTPQTVFVNNTSSTDIKNNFNNGDIITLPIKNTDFLLNTLGATVNNDIIKINDDGIYQLSASLNIFLKTENVGENVFVAFNIQKSKDGTNWTAISGARPIFIMTEKIAINYNILLPTTLASLEKNDFIRLIIFRTKTSGNTLQGSNLIKGDVVPNSQHGTKAYTLSISKM